MPMIASGGPDGIWCTGYSEPNAGSDFANIKTRAIRQGDEYIVNGRRSGQAVPTAPGGAGLP